MKTKYDLSKLTQDHIQELIKEPNIHEMFVRIGVVKNEIPFGSWVVDYKYPKWMLKYEEEKSYGFDGDGNWNIINQKGNPNYCERHRIATPEEVTKRLIEYAKGIGMVKGAKIKRLLSVNCGSTIGDSKTITDNSFYMSNGHLFSENLMLFCGDNGEWATIIQQEETYIKIPLSEIKATPNDCELGKLVRQIAG